VKSPWSALLVLVCACANEPSSAPRATGTSHLALSPAPALSATRHLRKIQLVLRGKEPTLAQYQAAMDAADGGSLDAFLDSEIDAALASSDFYDQMLEYGHDYLRIGDYVRGSTEGGTAANFKGSEAIRLTPCDTGTMHAGALGHFSTDLNLGDPFTTCDDAAAVLINVEPWWAPGTTVQVIGRSGNGLASANGTDCGRAYMGDSDTNFSDVGCGCGPNLLYCTPKRLTGPAMYPRDYESDPFLADSQRRLLYEEPARLFAFIATTGAPFTDLVNGTYTVAPRQLQHLYVRWGRMNSDNATVSDMAQWWKTATDNWDKVEQPALNPSLLPDRTYLFDPRTDMGSPRGVPAAGVLTLLGPNVWYPRERVRAARWLEIFACRNFTAPDPAIVFMPPFNGDPERSGSCQHCHQTIDPAAIHFKRLEVEDDTPRHGQGYVNFGGIGSWQWRQTAQASFADPNSPGGIFWYQPYGRWNVSFAHDTFLTPVTAAGIMANPDARFLDFLPPGNQLFGLESDGTIGPLGFGKLVVASGEIDRCAVDKLFARFMGRPLDVTLETSTENQLINQFVQGGRAVGPFVKVLLKSDEFGRGL
jgi:hypothetical protein